jgi:HSP90 family molecular chaperone
LTVRDNGTGVARAAVVDLTGALARSGAAERRASKTEAASGELIARFGIDVHFSFMVVDTVELLTRKGGR